MSKKILWASLLGILLLTSCASRKDIVYLQDMQPGTKYPYDTRYEAVIRRDDRLSITVSNKNPELAIPFNIYGGTFKVGTDGDVTADASTRVNEKGYRVDVDGDIDFPILGILHVEGLTVSEVDGERQMFMHDLKSKDIFESPCFYLQQNDVVYVEPKYGKRDREDRGWQISTTLLSIASVICSLLWVLK